MLVVVRGAMLILINLIAEELFKTSTSLCILVSGYDDYMPGEDFSEY